MIRVLIALLALFLVWVLFLSGFSKQKKIIISVVTVIVCAAALWLDGYGEKPKEGIVSSANIVSCGLEVVHSYRTNFDIDLCLSNTAERGKVQRLHFAIVASSCDERGECSELQRVERDVLFVIESGQSATLKDNLSFNKIDPKNANVAWSTEILQVKAIK